MLRKLYALTLLVLAFPGAALALASAPVPTAPYTASGTLFDKIAKTTLQSNVAKNQGIQTYVLTAHDSNYQYALPLCDGANLVEVNGATVDPNSLIPGDTLALSVQPNALTDAKACIGRVVRQQVARAASAGECLQNFQVKQEIEGNPSPLFINTEYTYLLRVYARPTLDCDGKAYGTSPITTVVAPGKPFVVTLARGNGAVNLMQWSLSTDAAGRASFAYTFTEPANNYEFQITPGGGNTAGDAIGWSADLTDPNPSPSPTAEPTASGGSPLQLWPIAVVLVVVVIAVGAGLELRHLQRKRRSHELPEDEYRRTPRF